MLKTQVLGAGLEYSHSTKEKKISNNTRIYKTSGNIKKPNLRSIGIEECCEMQANGRDNLFREIIKFPNLGNEVDIQIQDAFRTPNRQSQKRTIS